MQSLYGYEIAKVSNYQVARDLIDQKLQPDWNEEIEEDLQKEDKTAAHELFIKHFDDPDAIDYPRERVRKATFEAISYYHNQLTRDKNFFSKNLLNQVDKIYEIYLWVLSLFIELSDFARLEQEKQQSNLQKTKATGDFKLSYNGVCLALKKNKILAGELIKKNIHWNENREFIRDIYRRILKNDPIYLAYDAKPEVSFEEQKEMINHISKKIVFQKRSVNHFRTGDVFLEPEAALNLFKTTNQASLVNLLLDAVPLVVNHFLEKAEIPADPSISLAQDIQTKVKSQIREIDPKSVKLTDTIEQRDNSQIPEEDSENAQELRKKTFKKKTIGEKIIGITLQEIIVGISDFLNNRDVNHTENQSKVLHDLSESVHLLFEKLGLPWTEHDRIHLKIVADKKKNAINDLFSELDLYWAEDHKIVQSLVQATLKTIQADTEPDFELAPLSKNWEEDKLFYLDLYRKNTENDQKHEQIIASKSRNWDLNRLALIDKVILKMAICEMIHFYSIPVKVSINEYIELSKVYSTIKSKQFVNGLLDSISQELIQKRIIKKSGRGLMDNK